MKNNQYRTAHQRRQHARQELSRQADAARLDALHRFEYLKYAKSDDRATLGAAVSWTLILAFGGYAAYLYATL